jgi:NTP pyrophosphatase (non-canonical NTP hydrolase)
MSNAAELTYRRMSRMNRARCEDPTGFNHKIDSWSTSDWITAVMGELGEAANVIKKLNRIRDGVRGNTLTEAELRMKLEAELADVDIYLDLLFQSLGLDRAACVIRTWDAKSKQIGYLCRLGGDHETV